MSFENLSKIKFKNPELKILESTIRTSKDIKNTVIIDAI